MMPIPARYEGVQESLAPGLPSFALWTIWQELPGHPYGSTLSIHTITDLGYTPMHQEAPCDSY